MITFQMRWWLCRYHISMNKPCSLFSLFHFQYYVFIMGVWLYLCLICFHITYWTKTWWFCFLDKYNIFYVSLSIWSRKIKWFLTQIVVGLALETYISLSKQLKWQNLRQTMIVPLLISKQGGLKKKKKKTSNALPVTPSSFHFKKM